MKPENEEKLKRLSDKYPYLFAFFTFKMLTLDMGFTTQDLLSAIPPADVVKIMDEFKEGQEEIQTVFDEISKDEGYAQGTSVDNSLKLSDSENKWVDQILSTLNLTNNQGE